MEDVSLTVFVVDDDEGIRSSLERALKLRGYQVETYESAQDFLSRYRAERPGCLLLDYGMPGMNGLELARAILQDPAPPQLTFLSMHDNREYREAARELGADFVSKADFVTELLPLLRARIPLPPASDALPGAQDPSPEERWR